MWRWRRWGHFSSLQSCVRKGNQWIDSNLYQPLTPFCNIFADVTARDFANNFCLFPWKDASKSTYLHDIWADNDSIPFPNDSYTASPSTWLPVLMYVLKGKSTNSSLPFLTLMFSGSHFEHSNTSFLLQRQHSRWDEERSNSHCSKHQNVDTVLSFYNDTLGTKKIVTVWGRLVTVLP